MPGAAASSATAANFTWTGAAAAGTLSGSNTANWGGSAPSGVVEFGCRVKLTRSGLVAVVLAILASALTLTAAARASGPSYSFADIGKIATVGEPVGVSDDGTVATSYGVWSKGTFISAPVGPSDGGALRAISPSGLVLGVSGLQICGHACFFTWDPTSGTITPYPVDPETLDPAGAPCGGVGAVMLDSANEAAGALAYLNASHHPHCTAGDTTTVGAYLPAPGSQPVRIPQLYKALAMAPNFVLGLGTDQTTPTLLNRTTSAITQFPTLQFDPTAWEHLASDGAFVATGSDISPRYVSPTGVISTLAAGQGQTYVEAINNGHAMVGFDLQDGGVLWPTPSSAPIELNSLSGTGMPSGDSITDARYIGNRGDIVGSHGTNGNDSVYVLSVAPSLTASIALRNADGSPFTGAGTKVGDTLKATVTLTNASATQPVTGLTVNPPLSVSPASSLQATGGPSPAVPTSLGASASAQYTVTYTIMGKGTATLSLAASGTQNGLAVSGTASAVAHLGQVMSVTVSFTDTAGNPIQNNTIKMVDTDTAEVPQDVTAVVTVKNVSTVQQDNVAFNGPLIASFHTATHSQQALPISVTSGPTGDSILSPLAPGASATRTYGLHLTNNGIFDLSAQVTSGDDGVIGPTNVSSGLGTLTANPTAILFLELHPVTDVRGLLRPGSPVLMSGTLVNRSQTQSIDLIPVEPTFQNGDNGGHGALVDASQTPLPDGVELPLAGDLPPAAVKNVSAELDTAPVAGTRATVSYDPHGYLVNADGSESALTTSQIRVAQGSSPVTLHFDTADPVDTSDAVSIAGSFAKAAFIGGSEWAYSGFKAGRELLEHPYAAAFHLGKALPGFVVAGANAASEAGSLAASIFLYGTYVQALSDEERKQFADGIVADYEAGGLKTAHTALERAADPILTDFETALQTGNWNKVAQMAGSGFSTGAGAVADVVFTDIAFQKLGLLAKGRKAAVAEGEMERTISLADAIAEAKVTGKAGAAIKGIFKGQNLLLKGAAALIDSYGLTPTQIRLLRDFCEHNGITVALRSRSKRAADLIKKGIAIGKNLVIKLKNVDEIDVAFLGYSRADLNTVVWAEPISQAELLRNIDRYRGITPELRELAEARYAQRVKEWKNHEYHTLINKWSREQKIELKFDGKGSGVPELDANRTIHRRFELEQVRTEKRYYKRFKVGNKAGAKARLVSVTQDVDLVAILGGNGSILSPRLRAKAYEYLENILGIQHPDTIPWVKDGEVAFEAKTKLLMDHLEGGEALATFGADGSVRAAFFNPVLTVFNEATKGGFVFFEGAYNNPYAREAIGALGRLLPK